MPADYQVKLDIFEGPLDLLLYLVRKEEVELYDLSLELLTRQYLDYLGAVAQPDLDLAGDFVAMAAHLIYLKSRRLLPAEHQAEIEEDADEEDPRWELIRQLVEYKKFKDVAQHLQATEGARLDLFARPPSEPPRYDPAEEAGGARLGELGLLDLLGAFQRALKRLESRPQERTVFEENFTVADKIQALRQLMADAGGRPVVFSTIFETSVTRVEFVVTLLALLELVRLKFLRVVQPEPFEEIQILLKD